MERWRDGESDNTVDLFHLLFFFVVSARERRDGRTGGGTGGIQTNARHTYTHRHTHTERERRARTHTHAHTHATDTQAYIGALSVSHSVSRSFS